MYLAGLSPESRWREAVSQTPRTADTPEAIASVFGTYLGSADDTPGGGPAS